MGMDVKTLVKDMTIRRNQELANKSKLGKPNAGHKFRKPLTKTQMSINENGNTGNIGPKKSNFSDGFTTLLPNPDSLGDPSNKPGVLNNPGFVPKLGKGKS
jgi:hypothetical protein